MSRIWSVGWMSRYERTVVVSLGTKEAADWYLAAVQWSWVVAGMVEWCLNMSTLDCKLCRCTRKRNDSERELEWKCSGSMDVRMLSCI